MELKDILSPDALTLFLYFVVPGFVAIQFYDIIVPSERRNFGESLIQVLSYGLITNVIFYRAYQWLLDVVSTGNFHRQHQWVYPLVYVLSTLTVVFVLPAILATVVYKARTGRQGWLNKLLARFGIKHIPLNPMPTAWDHFFSLGEPCVIVFHMKNGDRLAGGFSKESYASAYPAEQQVYVQELLTIDEQNGKFERIENHPGAIIRFEDCDYIETIVPQPQTPQTSAGP